MEASGVVAEYRFFPDGSIPHVSTATFHAPRPRASHLEQQAHRGRLSRTAHIIRSLQPRSVVDLGCGDGGLLSLMGGIDAWGYDFQPSNVEGWTERGVKAEQLDFVAHPEQIVWGEVTAVTEVLEHVADPHGLVELIAHHSRYVVASSPHNDTPEYHAEEHAWGWDMPGYHEMFFPHFDVFRHEPLGWCQILAGRSKCL
jgi:2-polyprenyl-3-methyl-5-hydroxy-6-metoxy-1,4-benzoquinol methylase